ncbi:MAG: MATE family efflux transporter, partial [Clostridia bacterium]
MEKINNNNFTQGSIPKHLVKFAIPLILALILQALYSAVDMIIVGKFGDTASVAAVATGGQVMHLVTVIISGLAMGLTVKIGQYVGAKDNKKLADSIGTSIFLFAVVTVIVTVIMLIFAKDISRLMRVPEEALGKTVDYVVICSIGTVFIVAYNVISGIFRGFGDSKTPLEFIAVACVINIIGDILLVGVFKLDTAGAAIATVFAQAMSVLFSLLMMKKRGFPFKFSRENIR